MVIFFMTITYEKADIFYCLQPIVNYTKTSLKIYRWS